MPIRNTRELLSPEKLRLKMLLYGISGAGKTLFASTAPNPIIIACETGHGGGIETIASSGLDFILPTSYKEVEMYCSGIGLEKYDTIVLDGFSYLADSLIKDEVLSIPRKSGDSGRRQAGVLELDDYQVLNEIERRLLARLLMLDKNLLVTCLQANYQPPEVGPQSRQEKMGGPDLSGALRSGAPAMFDQCFRLDVRSTLRDPKDAKSRFLQRVLVTEGDGKYLAKSRLRNGTASIFPSEVLFDMDKQTGTYNWFLEEAKKAYSKTAEKK